MRVAAGAGPAASGAVTVAGAAAGALATRPADTAGADAGCARGTVSVPGGRDLAIATLPLAEDSAAALVAYLATFRAHGWRKGLVFCNTRAEVEAYATAMHTAGSAFGNQIFVHYPNLERQRRRVRIHHLRPQRNPDHLVRVLREVSPEIADPRGRKLIERIQHPRQADLRQHQRRVPKQRPGLRPRTLAARRCADTRRDRPALARPRPRRRCWPRPG